MSKSGPDSGNYARADITKLQREVHIAPVGRGSSDRLRGKDASINARRAEVGARVNKLARIEGMTLADIEACQGWLGQRDKKGKYVLPPELEKYRKVLERPLAYMREIVEAMKDQAEGHRKARDPQKMYELYLEGLTAAAEAGLIDAAFFKLGEKHVRNLYLAILRQQTEEEPNVGDLLEEDGLSIK